MDSYKPPIAQKKYCSLFSFIVLLLLPISIFAQETEIRSGKYENGKLKFEGTFMNGHPVGDFKRYYPNTRIKAQMFYSMDGDTVDAVLFDPMGIKGASGRYIRQKKEGEWTYYSPKGSKILIANYSKDLLQGKAIRFYPNGQVLEKTEWDMNRLHGLWESYDESGQLKFVIPYNQNKRQGEIKVYYPNGKLETIGAYENNVRIGTWSYYNPQGEIAYQVKYDHGKVINQAELTRVKLEQLRNYEKNKGLLDDPQHFLQNPTDYFIKR